MRIYCSLFGVMMFSDDTYFGYKARISYSLFSSTDFNEVYEFIKSTTIVMKKIELNDYLPHPDHYKYAFIARLKGQIVGILMFTDFEHEKFINHLHVAPIHRFKGIGTGLMKELKAFNPLASISYLDSSNNYMPWMDELDSNKKSNLMNKLGSFYKKQNEGSPNVETMAVPERSLALL